MVHLRCFELERLYAKIRMMFHRLHQARFTKRCTIEDGKCQGWAIVAKYR